MRREFPEYRRPSQPAAPVKAGTAGPLWGLPARVLLASLCLVCACTLVSPADAATLWRKRGANGEWVYFDRPTAGAEPYEFAVYTPGGSAPAAAKPAPRVPATAPREPVAGGPPRAVAVLFPANDAVIQFGQLDKRTIERVVDKLLVEFEAQLEQKGVQLHVDEAARAWLGEKGYDPKMGARPMARLIQDSIKRPLAEELLFGKLADGGHVYVSVGPDGALKLETRSNREPALLEEREA